MNHNRTHIFAVAILSMLAACSGASPSSSDAEPLTTAQTGLTRVSIIHDEVTRESLLYVPDSYDGSTALPVVLNFHGFGGTSDYQMQTSDMRDLAEAERFILAYPQGTLLNGDPHWNTAPVGGDNKSTTDDFGFIEALLDGLENVYSVNTSKVYATGYSNGGDFSYSLACFLNDRFTAIAPVSGLMGDQPEDFCEVSHPTSAMIINGTADPDRPYQGINDYLISVDTAVDFWRSANNIDDNPVVTTIDENRETIEKYEYPPGTDGAEVTHFKVIEGGHIWFNFTESGVDTNRLIWDFLSRFEH